MATTRWCPSCGAEYRPGVESCAECGVALVDVRPPRSDDEGQAGDERASGEPVEYDLTDWPEDARRDLEWMLHGRGIAFAWPTEGVLVVPEARAEEVDGFLDYLAAGSPAAEDVGVDGDVTEDWRLAETVDEPVELSLDDFYEGDDARTDSDEVAYGLEWTDADGVSCEVSWIEDTGELFIMHARKWEPYSAEIIAVIPSRADVDRMLYGWERAMSGANSVQWVRDQVRAARRQEPA